MTNQEQFNKVHKGLGFIAALDQSGGSTPKTLANYGIPESAYTSEDEMFNLVHEMRSRIIASPEFNGERILGAILFQATMMSQIDGLDTADYLWQRKQVVPFLKVDNGLAEEAEGVQLMKPIPELDQLLDQALGKHIFGTKMRSVIKSHNQKGIAKIAQQQFELASRILARGLVPIVEPEVDIHASDKAACEQELLVQLTAHLDRLAENQVVMLKLTLPETDDLYLPLTRHPRVLRVVALSGGYSPAEANARLARNHGVVASFSRVLSEGLLASQSDAQFDEVLGKSITSIFDASVNKV